MRHRLLLSVVMLVTTVLVAQIVHAQCVPTVTSDNAPRIYYHNDGQCVSCIQDFDMDFPELDQLVATYGAYLGSGNATMVVGDIFAWNCSGFDQPHGETVLDYLEFSSSLDRTQIVKESSLAHATWPEFVSYLAGAYGEGTVVNLSNGDLIWKQGHTQAVNDAYSNDVILVGALPTFAGGDALIGDKCITSIPFSADGQFVSGLGPGAGEVNALNLLVPTSWYSGSEYLLAMPTVRTAGTGMALTEHGSFTAPLLAGSLRFIVDLVMSREPAEDYSVDRVFDYLVSGADRNLDPSTYNHELQASFPSRGPWSPLWGYGVISPWKATLYAAGFGRLEVKDAELDPGVTDPDIVFSDNFELRGDLFVPASQSFRVNHLAGVEVVTATPEGPTDLGIYPTVQEIRVAGSMRIESDPTLPGVNAKGTNATITVDAGGSVTVEDGGLLTISAGQFLMAFAGSNLLLENGGEIRVESGGQLILLGDADISGLLTIDPGAFVAFGVGSSIALNSDLVIPSGADWLVGSGVPFTVGAVDLGSSGADPSRVEVVCEGTLSVQGNLSAAITFQGASSGAGVWAGLRFDSSDPGTNILQHVQIRDAVTGVSLAGTAAIATAYLDIADCVTGVKVENRSNNALDDLTVSDCDRGIDLSWASPSITGCTISGNTVGVQCTVSNPTVRSCTIYSNQVGVATMDSQAIPDLGTTSSPGNNDFKGPGPANLNNVSAIDPSRDIYAQYNWWGSRKASVIKSMIIVLDDTGTPWLGSVIYRPYLTGPPSMLKSGVSEWAPASVVEPARLGFLASTFNLSGNNTEIRFALPASGSAQVSVFDLRGRHVKTLARGFRGAGDHVVRWDGSDRNGHSVSSGVYFLKLTSGASTATAKIVRVR